MIVSLTRHMLSVAFFFKDSCVKSHSSNENIKCKKKYNKKKTGHNIIYMYKTPLKVNGIIHI